MKRRIIYRKPQGFTLIETLVSLVVAGVIAAIAAPSFISWLSAERVKDTLIKVEGALKEARSSAVKKGRSCTLRITAQSITAFRIDPVSGNSVPDPGCLPTGTRDFSNQASVVGLVGTGGSTGTLVTFSLRGTTPVTQSTGAILVRRTDSDNDQKIKCLVVSSGVGLIRTGSYSASTVPAIADLPAQPVPVDPNNITAAETEAINAWQAQKDARDAQVETVVNNCISPL
jgi:prepilin-type N-terminal cleavage/methylation domain-containing protein